VNVNAVAWTCAAALLAAPVSAADPPGFALWKAANLKGHDAALATHIGDDHSSRETLADYTSHRFRMLYRDGDGNPEQHDAIIDIVFVESGEGTHIPAGIPHSFLVPSGKHFTYVLLKIPSA
jgi:hypothetical protein